MLYFAYGSNMNWPQMKGRCPSAEFVSVARLKDHRLAFTRKSDRRGCGSADAVREQGHDVWGVVYQIEEREIGRLDEVEDFVPGRAGNGYTRQQCYVYADGNEERPFFVSLYFAEKQKNPPLPSADYKRLIVEGARHWHLPQWYIEKLEQIRVAPR
ncbi:MAG: gamma-glutamylcyclotransferase family protein [Candidatus Binatia bacterium]